MPKVVNIKPVIPHIWIPPTMGALYKLEITRSDGNTDDITNEIYEGEIIDGCTDTIGNFTFLIDNSDQRYRGVWSGNEIFKFYCDYATSATTLRFRGRIEQVSYLGHQIRIKGRAEAKNLLDVTVTKAYSSQETSTIITDLFDTYATSFTYTNVNVSSTNVTVNWYQKPMWECIQELCKSSDFDFYIDCNLDAHYFNSGTINNTTDAIVHENNLLEVSDFAYDQSLLKNKVTVYGANIGDLPLFKSAEDITSQANYGIKELIINDTNITTETQCQERADYELSVSKDPPLVGDVTGIGLATIQPGENIMISDPMSNLNPNYYRIMKYKHDFRDYMKTTVTIEKEPKSVYHIIRERISAEQKLSETPNPNEMKYTWNFDFDTDTGVHSNTEIVSGVLKTDGSASGTWVSTSNVITSNATYYELRVVGETLDSVNYYLSTDGGVSWQSIAVLKTSYSCTPPGVNLKIKVELNSADSQIDALCLLYKT